MRTTSVAAATCLGSVIAGCNIGAGPYDLPQTLDCDFCSGESVCLDGACEPAFPRSYRLNIHRAVLPLRPAREEPCWDKGPCSLPEPRLQVYLNNEQIAAYAGEEDTYTAFGTTFDLHIPASSSLVIMAVDADDRPRPDQIAFACYFSPLRGKHVRRGVLSCTENGGAIEATIKLPPSEQPDPEPEPEPEPVPEAEPQALVGD